MDKLEVLNGSSIPKVEQRLLDPPGLDVTSKLEMYQEQISHASEADMPNNRTKRAHLIIS